MTRVFIYIYIYIYIKWERERERDFKHLYVKLSCVDSSRTPAGHPSFSLISLFLFFFCLRSINKCNIFSFVSRGVPLLLVTLLSTFVLFCMFSFSIFFLFLVELFLYIFLFFVFLRYFSPFSFFDPAAVFDCSVFNVHVRNQPRLYHCNNIAVSSTQRQYPSRCMQAFPGQPKLGQRYVWVYKRTSLISGSLLIKLCSICIVCFN